MLVNTLEGRCIGETRYTYNTNILAQFEHCVKALDDEDMELEFTDSAEEQHVTLNYRSELKLNPSFWSTLFIWRFSPREFAYSVDGRHGFYR